MTNDFDMKLFFYRFWYSVFELVTIKSLYKDSPYLGIALVLNTLIDVAFLLIIGYWKCLSIVYSIPSPCLNYSKIQVAVMFGVPLILIYIFNKKHGEHLIKMFENESENSRKKRKKEFFFVIAFCFIALFVSVIWRICLG